MSARNPSRSRKKVNLLWVTDPWETLDHPKDTSLRLMEEGHAMGLPQSWCSPLDFILSENPVIRAKKLKSISRPRVSSAIEFHPEKSSALSEFTHVFFRVDPPVNTAFLMALQMLKTCLDPKKTEIVNPLEALCLQSEKLIPLGMPKFTPKTLVTSQYASAESFYSTQGKILLKPLNGAQSIGIMIPQNVTELRTHFLKLTENESAPCLLQKFSPTIKDGEKRLWFSDGKVLCFGQKLPKKGDFIINMDGGGSVKATPLTPKEKKAIPEISKTLNRLKIRWAAVDLIDGLITDFNHTSPGLIIQLEEVHGENFSRALLKRTLGI